MTQTMQTIKTTRTSTASGAGRVLAVSNGKRLTSKWDLSKSAEWNHGDAAANLLIAKFPGVLISLTDDNLAAATHDQSDDGQKHVFTFPVGV